MIWFLIIYMFTWTISRRLFKLLHLISEQRIDNFILVSGLGIFYQGALEFWYSLIYNLGSKRGLTTVCVEGSIKYWWRLWLNINDIFWLLCFRSQNHMIIMICLYNMLHILCLKFKNYDAYACYAFSHRLWLIVYESKSLQDNFAFPTY